MLHFVTFYFVQVRLNFRGIAMEKITIELLNDLKNPDCSLAEYLTEHKNIFVNEDVESFWRKIIQSKNLSKTHIINESDFSYCYFYEVISGRKSPTKDKVVRLALTLNMTVEECQQALRISGRSVLYPKSRRDSILIYSIEHGMTVMQCNSLLNDYGEEELK